MTLNEYKPGTAFSGVLGRTGEESEPAWPEPNRAREGAPNVLFVVLDDTGFAHLGAYGSPISTPNMDRLAANGLTYTNMHTTALCSPTRSCILTGRNHHSNGLACITEGSLGYPGANGNIPFENGFLGEILLNHGYSTYAVGKWHLTPADQTSAAGPYDRWPLGRGFERYYGFLGGDTHQYYPELVHDNHTVEPPKTPEEGYHLTEDLVDKAISFIADTKQAAPNKPFFMYFAPGAMHAPHHVPQEWADKYAGKFDGGWSAYREAALARQKELGIVPPDTELSRHDPDVPDWDGLPAEEQRLYARMMEVYAGMLEHTDHHIGRIIDLLEETGELGNTMIMVISDNGASSEGGPSGSVNESMFFNNVPESVETNLAAINDLGGPKYFNHYPWGWAWAGNTPFKRWKKETYRGGVSDPLVVQWLDRVPARGELRHQYSHAIDMVPTVLELLDIDPPNTIKGVTQSPIEGVSFAHTIPDADQLTRHHTQYFEMMGHRSIYHDGWRAVCPWPGESYTESGGFFGDPMSADRLTELDATGWELYNVADDVAETQNLAEQNRPKLIEMIGRWYAEAGKYNVFPIDSRGVMRLLDERPTIAQERSTYVYRPNTQAVPSLAAAKVLNRPHSITADVVIPAGGAEGVLLSHGGNDGGYAFYLKDGRLKYVHNYVALEYLEVVSADPVPAGHHELRFEFEPTGTPEPSVGKGSPGRAQLYVDGTLVGNANFEYTTPLVFGIAGGAVACGVDGPSPVVPHDYEPPYAFTGTINKVTIDVSGELIEDDEATMRRLMAHQ